MAALFMCACASALVEAASLQVNPVHVQLGGDNTSEAITIRNTGTDPVVVQTSIQAWSQADDDDVYAPTGDALATPPIATIAPGAEQIVRVGLRRRLRPARELAFRVFVQEVPSPSSMAAAAPVGLRVAVRIGLPVFVVPDAGAHADLVWSYAREQDGRLRISARNRGNGHARITDLVLHQGEQPIAQAATLRYVLAGSERTWLLAPAARTPEARLRVRAQTDAGEIDADVPAGR